MSEWETEQPGGTEGQDDEQEQGGDAGKTGQQGWDETNDEPAQGEGGQEAV